MSSDKKRFSSITKKVWIGVLAVSSCITILVTGVQLYSNYHSEVDVIMAKLDIIHTTNENGIASAVWDVNENQLNAQLTGILKFPVVDRVVIEYQGLDGKTSIEKGEILSKSLVQTYDLNHEGEKLGEIVLSASIQQVYGLLWEQLLFILMMQAIKTFLASFLIMLTIWSLVTKHIIKISKYFEKEKDNPKFESLSIDRSLEESDDELKTLVTNINTTMKSLKVYQTHMEDLVKEKTSELENALETKGNFLANMSHEFRTPMNGILTTSRMLLDTVKDDESKKLSDIIHRSSNNLLLLINDVLDLTKLEGGNLALEEVPFDLKKMVEITLELHKNLADEKGLELQFIWEAELFALWVGDPARIQQIFINLISNAVKFTEKGHVRVEVSLAGEGSVNVKISDSGIGIPEDKQLMIFEPFSQVDESFTRVYGGTGLGLGLTKKFLELMGGKIQLTSEVGSGTTFDMNLPLGKVDAKNIEVQERTRTATRDYKKHALLAEDNKINQKVTKLVLKKLGIDITLAENGQDALDKWDPKTMDFIILDIQMPVMDGLEAVKQFRKNSCEVAIVAMTANFFQEDVETYLSSGFDACIAKPLIVEEMVSIFDIILRKKHSDIFG